MKQIGILPPPDALPSQSIGKIASAYTYVHEGTLVEDFLEHLKDRNEEVPAFAVVDDAMKVKGVIESKQLTALLSRPFGLDVLKRRPVSIICKNRPVYKLREHIFIIAEELSHHIQKKEEAVFVLADEDERFRAIFTTVDLLTYLSELTQKDIALANNVQRRIVRERQSVLTTHLEVVASSTTAKGVGGDFYSIKKIGATSWFIALCDVSGKGVAASIVTAMLHGSVETFDFQQNSVTDFVEHVNRSVYSTFEADKFLTGIFIVFDEMTGAMTVLDMGHSYFGFLRNNKLLRVVTATDNLPVGISPALKPKPTSIKLLRNDILILVTDGLTEQQNISGEEYSMERLLRLVQKYQSHGPEAIRDKIRSDFNTFRGDTPYHDDVTFLIFRYPDAAEVEKDIDPSHSIEWEIASS
jgi:phosphoserine phosphatase RsbU/P